jgi:hypothetical protein
MVDRAQLGDVTNVMTRRTKQQPPSKGVNDNDPTDYDDTFRDERLRQGKGAATAPSAEKETAAATRAIESVDKLAPNNDASVTYSKLTRELQQHIIREVYTIGVLLTWFNSQEVDGWNPGIVPYTQASIRFSQHFIQKLRELRVRRKFRSVNTLQYALAWDAQTYEPTLSPDDKASVERNCGCREIQMCEALAALQVEHDEQEDDDEYEALIDEFSIRMHTVTPLGTTPVDKSRLPNRRCTEGRWTMEVKQNVLFPQLYQCFLTRFFGAIYGAPETGQSMYKRYIWADQSSPTQEVICAQLTKLLDEMYKCTNAYLSSSSILGAESEDTVRRKWLWKKLRDMMAKMWLRASSRNAGTEAVGTEAAAEGTERYFVHFEHGDMYAKNIGWKNPPPPGPPQNTEDGDLCVFDLDGARTRVRKGVRPEDLVQSFGRRSKDGAIVRGWIYDFWTAIQTLNTTPWLDKGPVGSAMRDENVSVGLCEGDDNFYCKSWVRPQGGGLRQQGGRRERRRTRSRTRSRLRSRRHTRLVASARHRRPNETAAAYSRPRGGRMRPRGGRVRPRGTRRRMRARAAAAHSAAQRSRPPARPRSVRPAGSYS